jgi:putative ABC transport system permease protein
MPQNTAILRGDINPEEFSYFRSAFAGIGAVTYKKAPDYTLQTNNDQRIRTHVLGVDNNFLKTYILDLSINTGVYSSTLTSGRLFSENELAGMESAVIINDSVAFYLYGNDNPLGKSILLSAENGEIKSYVIIGTIKDSYDSASSYVSYLDGKKEEYDINIYTTEKNIVTTSNSYGYALLFVSDMSLSLLEERVADYLPSSSVSVYSYADIKDAVEENHSMFVREFVSLIVIIVVCEMISLSIFMIFAIKERVGEIGIRKAIGASDNEIAVQFVTEYAVLGGIGTVIGCLVGFFINLIMLMSGASYGFSFVNVTIVPVLLIALFSITIVTFLSLIPALIARHVKIINALRFV